MYELVRYIEDEEEKVAPGAYKDGSRMHGGGSDLTAIQTFVKYFMLRFCAFLWYWIAFFRLDAAKDNPGQALHVSCERSNCA